MFGACSAWLVAAHAAVTAALPNATVSLGPLVTLPGSGDIVLVGQDDQGDAEPGLGWEYTGGWHDASSGSRQGGEAVVYVTCWSRSGGDLTMADRLTAAHTLHAAVLAAVIPTTGGSGLGVADVLWAEQAGVRSQLLPMPGGNQVRSVISITLRILSS